MSRTLWLLSSRVRTNASLVKASASALAPNCVISTGGMCIEVSSICVVICILLVHLLPVHGLLCKAWLIWPPWLSDSLAWQLTQVQAMIKILLLRCNCKRRRGTGTGFAFSSSSSKLNKQHNRNSSKQHRHDLQVRLRQLRRSSSSNKQVLVPAGMLYQVLEPTSNDRKQVHHSGDNGLGVQRARCVP